jgi:transcriptional regulator with XRE-family HTH domain
LTPPPGSRALGERLKALREAAGLSGAALAQRLGPGWRQSKISKIETGVRVPTTDEITAWAEAVGADASQLLALRGKTLVAYAAWRDRLTEAGGGPGFQRELAALEASCTFIGEYQPSIVPGLLQTPAYARQMIGPANNALIDGMTAEELGQLVAAKVRRAGILHEGTRRIIHVVGEAALRTRIGVQTYETLRGQLEHLAELATLPGHEFGIIPFWAVLPIEPASGFVLYDQDLVGIDHAGGDLQITDPNEIARYAKWLGLLQEIAVAGEEAADFCRRVAAEMQDATAGKPVSRSAQPRRKGGQRPATGNTVTG